MVAVKTTFDGRAIQVPPELQGVQPGEVLIVFDERRAAAASAARPSIWDVFGSAPMPRSAADIDEQVRQERNAWGEQ